MEMLGEQLNRSSEIAMERRNTEIGGGYSQELRRSQPNQGDSHPIR